MSKVFIIDGRHVSLGAITEFVFQRSHYTSLELSPSSLECVQKSHQHFLAHLEKNIPIYGVTTGFGDSVSRSVPKEKSEELQANLIAYLLCGSGPKLSVEASRATFLIRLYSLARGYSGVSPALLDRMCLYLEKDWLPVIPREGSLGASGDLIPLAYLAQILQGEGQMYVKGEIRSAREVLHEARIEPYRLKSKEGLALVNGTSAMAGLCVLNFKRASYLSELACTASAWMCLALQGRTEAFGVLVNEKAKTHSGQARVAQKVRALLDEEGYTPRPLDQIGVQDGEVQHLVQDRYSLRCVPQILGPVFETLDLVRIWIENEINSTSDNPLFDPEGNIASGGNFYGGYLGHGMDYLKISLAHIADMLDRQLTLLIDEKTNRGLPANLAAWNHIAKEDRMLHHGLKGLHQAVNALTSEVLARATPNTIFSRSSESHNQDKVSLGMSAAVQCSEMIEQLYTILSMYLTCLAQALELRGVEVKGQVSVNLLSLIRIHVPFVKYDMALGEQLAELASQLKRQSLGE